MSSTTSCAASVSRSSRQQILSTKGRGTSSAVLGSPECPTAGEAIDERSETTSRVEPSDTIASGLAGSGPPSRRPNAVVRNCSHRAGSAATEPEESRVVSRESLSCPSADTALPSPMVKSKPSVPTTLLSRFSTNVTSSRSTSLDLRAKSTTQPECQEILDQSE